MAFSRHLYPKYDFVFTQCHGVVDDNSLRIHLLGFRIDAGGMGTIKELADARGIEKADKTTVSGLIELAGLDKKQSAGREEFLAVVVTEPLIHKMARIYTDLLTESKKGTGIFSGVNEALSWLGYNTQEATLLRKFIRKSQE